jgi:hypothetical protein
MLKERAEAFIDLGEAIADARVIFAMDENYEDDAPGLPKKLSERGVGEVHSELLRLLDIAERLELLTSTKLIGRRVGYRSHCPRTVDRRAAGKTGLVDAAPHCHALQ